MARLSLLMSFDVAAEKGAGASVIAWIIRTPHFGLIVAVYKTNLATELPHNISKFIFSTPVVEGLSHESRDGVDLLLEY